MKILGFVFGTKPNVQEHLNYMYNKYNRALWSINHIKRAGLKLSVIVRVYCSMLRPIIEFCSPVYHSLLTNEQSQRIENLQKMTLKIIYGFGFNYSELLIKSGLSTLEERRKLAFTNFTKSIALNERYSGWFPLNNNTVNLRSSKRYVEEFARTERLYNSPLFAMRRELNNIQEEHTETEQ